jgi:hypothetical protein
MALLSETEISSPYFQYASELLGFLRLALHRKMKLADVL